MFIRVLFLLNLFLFWLIIIISSREVLDSTNHSNNNNKKEQQQTARNIFPDTVNLYVFFFFLHFKFKFKYGIRSECGYSFEVRWTPNTYPANVDFCIDYIVCITIKCICWRCIIFSISLLATVIYLTICNIIIVSRQYCTKLTALIQINKCNSLV